VAVTAEDVRHGLGAMHRQQAYTMPRHRHVEARFAHALIGAGPELIECVVGGPIQAQLVERKTDFRIFIVPVEQRHHLPLRKRTTHVQRPDRQHVEDREEIQRTHVADRQRLLQQPHALRLQLGELVAGKHHLPRQRHDRCSQSRLLDPEVIADHQRVGIGKENNVVGENLVERAARLIQQVRPFGRLIRVHDIGAGA